MHLCSQSALLGILNTLFKLIHFEFHFFGASTSADIIDFAFQIVHRTPERMCFVSEIKKYNAFIGTRTLMHRTHGDSTMRNIEQATNMLERKCGTAQIAIGPNAVAMHSKALNCLGEFIASSHRIANIDNM